MSLASSKQISLLIKSRWDAHDPSAVSLETDMNWLDYIRRSL
jgi:hypothetical protein